MIYPAHGPFPLPDPLLAEVERLTAAIARVEALIGDCNGHRDLPLDITRCPWCMVRAALTERET